MNDEFTAITIESESSKAEILRKAVTIFVATHKVTWNGTKVGIVDGATDAPKTEFISL